MTREGALLVMVGFAALLLALMAWGWRGRSRRDRGLVAPTHVPADAEVRASFAGLYVATTRHEAPLDRLVIRHLAFRGRVAVGITASGVLLEIAGEPDVFLPAERLVGVGRATWTIDRVVEKDGLVMISWQIDELTVADSYVRLQGADPDALVAAVEHLLTRAAHTPPTGSDA